MTYYILDPVCVQEFGHNLPAIKRYGNYIKSKKNETVVALIGKNLRLDHVKSNDFNIAVDNFFRHYYPDFIKINDVKRFLNDKGELSKNIIEIATEDLFNFFQKYKITSKDVLFYPSVDYFSLHSILGICRKLPAHKIPKIIIRFIGVMEYDHYKIGVSLEGLLKDFGVLLRDKAISIKFSAESEVMSEFIKINSGVKEVIVTPTLVNHSFFEYPKNEIFTIGFPGAARRDKGFCRISSILECFEEINQVTPYRVLLQLLSPSELEHYESSTFDLVKNGKVVLLPHSLDDEEIMDIFKLSDLIVAPYDKNIYRYRSSAIMAEAAIYGRPIVASIDCGFSSQITDHKLGFLADSDADFAKKIEIFRALSQEKRSVFSRVANENFLEFSNKAYELLFERTI